MLTIINHDKKFLEIVVELRDSLLNYHALYFCVSALDKSLQHNKRLTLNNLTSHFNQHEGYLYITSDNDFFVMLRKSSEQQLKDCIKKLMEAVVGNQTDHQAIEQSCCKSYNMSKEWQIFFNICKKKVNHGERLTKKSKLTPALLLQIENAMTGIDLTNTLRSQSVCTVTDNKVTPVFSEVYVRIEHLQKTLMMDVDLHAHRGLFRCLTEILDKHVLKLLQMRPGILPKKIPVSVNLNIETILSESFETFHQMVKDTISFGVIIEINIADAFNDLYAYTDAREYVQSLGYRVCIDGLSDLSFVQLNRQGLGFDLLKMRWNNDVKENIDTPENNLLEKTVQKCGGNRVILSHCDEKGAIEYGKALGISLFQGRYLDLLLNPGAKTVN